ncbi:MAG TPA: T9SS type A sorting domain-containing protein [Flavobacterium sp.]
MKKLCIIVTVGLFFQHVNAQIINFVDPAFKTALLSVTLENYMAYDLMGIPTLVDLNENGEIELSEAANITALSIGTSGISDLGGLEHFVNLNYLEAFNNNLTSFDVGDLAPGVSLHFLSLNGNDISTFEYINTGTHHTDLNLNNNPLVQMTVMGKFFNIRIENNLLTELDLSQVVSEPDIYLNNSPNLIYINIKDGVPYSSSFNGLYAPSAPNLQYVCTDEGEMGLYVPDYVQVNSYCTFTPGGTFYTITGTNSFDGNGNGCDAADVALPQLKFNISNGSTMGSLYSNSSGNYSIPVLQGTHTLTPVLENPSFFTISPASATVAFPATTSPAVQNFCITPNGIHNDILVTAMPIGQAVPGFDANYKIIVQNVGNQLASGTVTFSYDDGTLDFISATGGAINTTVGQVTMDFNALAPFSSQPFMVKLNLNSPMESPALNQGDILQLTASAVTSATDESLVNNAATIDQTVVNSMDPNHKTCVEGATIPPSMVGEYVHYMIEFENVGTFPASNVVVKDMIDTAKFDVSTLVPVSSSHSFTTRITQTNKVEFIFEGINLPFDDANNDGYVAFKIKTKPTLALNDTFSNTASIYFDYNFPIVTNTETTTISALSNPGFDFESFFTVHPNPVNERLNISTIAEISVSSMSIYNMLGQQLIVIPNAENINVVDVSMLQSGTYFLKIYSDKGNSAIKFIKQ